MYTLKIGKTYGAGVVIATANKSAAKESSAKNHNPEGTGGDAIQGLEVYLLSS